MWRMGTPRFLYASWVTSPFRKFHGKSATCTCKAYGISYLRRDLLAMNRDVKMTHVLQHDDKKRRSEFCVGRNGQRRTAVANFISEWTASDIV